MNAVESQSSLSYDSGPMGSRALHPETYREDRPSDLEVRIDQLDLAVRKLRESHEYLHQIASRFRQIAQECSQTPEWLARRDEQQTSLAEVDPRWSDGPGLDRRLLDETARRLYQFERRIEQELNALRQIREEPLKNFDRGAAMLVETCVNAIKAASTGFERARSRFAALHEDVSCQLAESSRDIRDAAGELRHAWAARAAASGEITKPRPLEDGVLPRHGPRHEAEGVAAAREQGRGTASTKPHDVKAASDLPRRRGQLAVAAMLVGILILGASTLRLRGRVEAGIRDAAARANVAERQANEAQRLAQRQIASAQEAARRLIAEAQRSAWRAQAMASVMAAPDLQRFDLSGQTPAPGAYAQALWSRSRGLVLTASELPRVPEGEVYQVWMLTRRAAVSAGLVEPDVEGRVSAVFETLPDLPRPVVGLIVTREAAGGSSQPTGTVYLARAG